MEKTFVLDTNVILFDPQSIFKFGKNQVAIPFAVIEEIDCFKQERSENGRNSRHFSRLVDKLRRKGSLMEGIPLESGGTLLIAFDHFPNGAQKKAHHFIDLNKTDNVILANTLALKKENSQTVLITKDTNLRLKADVLGISAEDYGQQRVATEDVYSGHRPLDIDKKFLETYKEKKRISLKKHKLEDLVSGIYPNEYITLQEKNNPANKSLGRYCAEKEEIVFLASIQEGVWGIHPRNIEQQFALDALLNDDIKLVTLVGTAGTGKTLMAIAAGLETTVSKESYGRLLVSRPVWPMGKDLGYLPGEINDKLTPWMRPIFDNMDFLFGQGRTDGAASYGELIDHGLLHIEPLTYIRGRSIPDQYLIVDEVQNLSPREVKAIITRAGEGAKIVLTGDCQQIDNPYLDEVNNGLIYAINRLKQENLMAHILLKTGERSSLSEAASKHL